MYHKEFDKWNKEKKVIDKKDTHGLFFKEREIWWCSLGVNVGFEQDGKNDNHERPILIIKKFNGEMIYVIPLTSTEKEGKYYFPIKDGEKVHSTILSQAKLMSPRRLLRKIKTLDKTQFEECKKRFLELLS